jgi:hypothetical protein
MSLLNTTGEWRIVFCWLECETADEWLEFSEPAIVEGECSMADLHRCVCCHAFRENVWTVPIYIYPNAPLVPVCAACCTRLQRKRA